MGQSCTIVVEKEVIAPRTADGFTRGTTQDGRIHHGNPEFISIDGPVPTFILGPGQVLHPEVLDPETYGE
jgi:hypothetical protein